MQEIYNQQSGVQQTASTNELAVSKVLRNTYALLALTIAFSAITASISTAMNFYLPLPWWGHLMVFYGLIFAIEKFKNSGLGLVLTFAFTGWLGVSLSPLLNMVLNTSGASPIIMSLGLTSLAFFGLSAYALMTRKDFSFLTGFIITGVIVGMGAMVLNIMFFEVSALHSAIMAVFLILSCAIILWQTSSIIHGGETNYISATVTLFVSIYNIFTILLSFMGDD